MPDSTNIIAHQTADLAAGTISPEQITCTQYDRQAKLIAVRLKENGKDWTIPTGYRANVRMRKADGLYVYNTCTTEGNIAYITLTEQMCGVVGEQIYVLEVINGDHAVQSVTGRLRVIQNPIDDEEADFTSTPEYTTIQTAVADAQQSAEEAQQALEQLLGSVTTICYGQCNTAANTAAKVVSCQGFNLVTGVLIAVRFTNENTANYPTLNVNSTGAKSIYGHSNYPPVGTGAGVWKSGEVKLFVYDGTNFRIVGTSALELCGGTAVSIANGGTGVSNTSRLSFYGTCSTAANTAAKVVSCPDFSLAAGVRIAVKFTNSNTAANVTLNVNSTGTKNVYLYGTTRWVGTPWQAQEIVEFIYDGTNYQMLGKSHLAS